MKNLNIEEDEILAMAKLVKQAEFKKAELNSLQAQLQVLALQCYNKYDVNKEEYNIDFKLKCFTLIQKSS